MVFDFRFGLLGPGVRRIIVEELRETARETASLNNIMQDINCRVVIGSQRSPIKFTV